MSTVRSEPVRAAGVDDAATLDLLYTDEQDQLRASVRGLLADRSPIEAVISTLDTDSPADSRLWRSLAELGCAGLPVPEQYGGAGATFAETAVVAEELGRLPVRSPFFGSAVLATAALLATGERELLPELAAGTQTATMAVPFGVAPGGSFPDVIRVDGDRLTGAVSDVVDARNTDVLLVPAISGGMPALYAVDAEAVRSRPVTSFDLTRPLTDLRFDGAAGRRIAVGADAERAVRRALVTGAAMLASEQLGVAERVLELAVAYLKTRYQFGRPIGSFQALKHRAADAWVSVTQAKAVARYAAACVAAGSPDTEIAAHLAQAFLSPVAVRVAEEALQFHGGIGFTWEYPIHVYLKRAKASALALGTADVHRAALGELLELPACR